MPRACERPPACKPAGRNDGSGNTHRKAEYTNATAPALPKLKQKCQQVKQDFNAVKRSPHETRPSGVDEGDHT